MNIDEIEKKYLVSRETRNERLKKCLTCEDLNVLNQCKHCYCFIHLKTWLKNEECAKPTGKKW